MKLSKDKLLQLWNALSELGKIKTNAKFSYAVARNKNLIEPEIKALIETQKVSDEYREYDTKRLQICKDMATKTNDGAPIMSNNEYLIEDRKTFDKKIGKLQKEHKVDIDVQKERIDQFNEILKEDIEFEFFTIQAEWLPDSIEANHLELMLDFIEGEP